MSGRTEGTRWTRWAGIVVAGAMALALGGCSWTLQVLGLRQPWQDLSECPHYWSRLGSHGDSLAPLAGKQVDVPEYNDCQRLVDPGHGRPYGPLAVVFASDRITSLLQDQADSTAHYGRPMAIAAATVLSVKGAYLRLGLATGFHCLYLWKRDTSWEARMVKVPGNGQACTRALDPTALTGRDLNVAVAPATGGGVAHPPVTRWERDAAGWNTIGILCGDEWCAVGDGTFTPATTPDIVFDASLDDWLDDLPNEAAAPATTAQLRELVRHRGWMDDQLLSPGPGAPGASALWAAVLPHPRLDAMPTGAFDGRWRVSAFVYVAPPTTEATTTLAMYRTKFNYDQGWNAIAMCHGTCAGVPSTLTCPGQWYSAIQPRSAATGTPPLITCVTRIDHPTGHVTGTARWRWIKNDETVWARCVDGCCEVQPRP